jgi:hypothetical protein
MLLQLTSFVSTGILSDSPFTLTHAMFLVMGGFAYQDKHDRIHPITVDDIFQGVAVWSIAPSTNAPSKIQFKHAKREHLVLGSIFRNLVDWDLQTIVRRKVPRHEHSEDPVGDSIAHETSQGAAIDSTERDMASEASQPKECIASRNSRYDLETNEPPESEGIDPESIRLIDLITAIPEADIDDRSKGDSFSKFVASVQAIWFLIQFITRLAIGLNVTRLEVVTLAYSTMSVYLYIFWWKKPKGVDRQIVLYTLTVDVTELHKETGLPAVIACHRSTNHANFILPKRSQVAKSRVLHFWDTILGQLPLSGSDDRVGLMWAGTKNDGSGPLFMVALLLAASYGAMHIVGILYVESDPSTTEDTLWLSNNSSVTSSVTENVLWLSAVVTTIIYPLMTFLFLGFFWLFEWLNGVLEIQLGGPIQFFSSVLHLIMSMTFPIVYVFDRIILLVLPFLQLRALPPRALQDIPWSKWFPHV